MTPFYTPELADRAAWLETAFCAVYSHARPFPHLIIDNFWPEPELREAVAALQRVPASVWTQETLATQTGKSWCADMGRLPPAAAQLLQAFNAPELSRVFSALTGIPDLQGDPIYAGGGYHRTEPGGRLGIHTDFNAHPQTSWYRRANALLYLNEDWEPGWGGGLELWSSLPSAASPRPARCECVITPKFNRLVLFTLSSRSFHGHPQPVTSPALPRLSLAAYYYTLTPPADFAGVQPTLWYS